MNAPREPLSVVVGIVGAEGAKFTPSGEQEARAIIRVLLSRPKSHLVSGGCHLGGVDIWAEEEAAKLGVGMTIFPPRVQRWEGYKERNLRIAEASDVVHCIAVARLSLDFNGPRFTFCYHCGTRRHIKSGGCWTVKRSRYGMLHVVANEEVQTFGERYGK